MFLNHSPFGGEIATQEVCVLFTSFSSKVAMRTKVASNRAGKAVHAAPSSVRVQQKVALKPHRKQPHRSVKKNELERLLEEAEMIHGPDSVTKPLKYDSFFKASEHKTTKGNKRSPKSAPKKSPTGKRGSRTTSAAKKP